MYDTSTCCATRRVSANQPPRTWELLRPTTALPERSRGLQTPFLNQTAAQSRVGLAHVANLRRRAQARDISILRRETSRPSQPSLKLPVANSRPRSSSSQLTETSRRLGKGWHSQPNQSEALHTDFFSHGLEPTCSRRLHSSTSCRLSLLLSVKLEAFSTAGRLTNKRLRWQTEFKH